MATGITPKYADGNDSGVVNLMGGTNDNYTGTIKYRKIGNFCNIVFDSVQLKADLSTTTPVTLVAQGTLPLPSARLAAWAGTNSATYGFGMITISTTGGMSFYKVSGTYPKNTNIYCSVTYLCA